MKTLEASVCVLSAEEIMNLLFVALVFVFEHLKVVSSGPLREAKRALRDDWLLKVVHYMESNPETLVELLNKNHDVMEGDMMLGTDRNAVGQVWPTLDIPYVIGPELASRTDDILSAMAMVSKQTCVTFHKRTTEKDYLVFMTSKGCASYVGFMGDEQPVLVAAQCTVGNIVHEILHALGFHHEHTRMDREQYITVLQSNIMSGMEKNFKKHEGLTFELPYDITSIMHYGSGFFSTNGLPTIVANKRVQDMGQRVKMTKTDVERVRHLYKCDSLCHPSEKEIVEDANVHIMKAHDPTSDQKHVAQS